MLDLSAEEVCVKRELKISRRPVAAAIVDDGSVLAVLSSNHTVTLYDLTEEKAKFMRSIPLENAPRTIALSPGAEVLGAAYNGGIEVYSLLPDALPTDCRAVNCDTVDTLAFSADGEVLVGTTLNCKTPVTVMVSAQHFSIDLPVEGLAQLWTTQVLFPRSSRDSSHASLLPEGQDDESTWTITYDRGWQMFRAVRVDDLRNGHTYFTGPRDSRTGATTPPTTLPAPTGDGRMVAAGFEGKIWIYGIPSTLEPPPEDRSQDGGASSGVPSRSNSTSGRTTNWVSGQLGTIAMPQWQVLGDNGRNVNIGGRELGELSSLSGIKFVKCVNGTERLVAVAGGGVDSMLGEGGEGEFVAIGGGRLILYDFDRTLRERSTTTISIEIGDGIQGPVETLEEQHNDIEVEVDIVRRRTVAQKRNIDRRQTMHQHHRGGLESSSSANTNFIPAVPRMPMNLQAPAPPRTPVMLSPRRQRTFDEDDEASGEGIDLPYSQGEPRSRTTLFRAATAARNVPQQANSDRYLRVVGPDGRPILQNQPIQETRNEDGTPWVPPPPPYTPRDDEAPPLPQHLLATLQGPSRVREPYMSSDYSPEPSPSIRSFTTLQRTRTNLGNTMDNIMRRPSVFRPTVNTSSTNLGVHPTYHGASISHSRSAPVSPAVSAPPPPIFTGPRTGPAPESAYAANQRRYELNVGFSRRGSAGDALSLPNTTPAPSISREASEPLLGQYQRQPSTAPYRQAAPQTVAPPRPPPLQTSLQTQHSPPQTQYYASMLSPEQVPPTHRDSPNYRAMPTRRPAPGRSPSRGRRVGGLQETYAAGAVATMSSDRRGPGSTRGSVRGGSQRSVGSRRVSRAERSARINVSEARRKKRERMAGEEGKGGPSCVIC